MPGLSFWTLCVQTLQDESERLPHLPTAHASQHDKQCNHRCKYNDQGCEVKMILKDLVTHEMKCPSNLVIQGDDHKLCLDGLKVSSVENVPSIDKCIEETGNISLCLQRNLAKNMSVKTQEVGVGIGFPRIQQWLNVEFSFKKA